MYSGTWFNEYVAVVEPPIMKGQVRVEEVSRTGTHLLSPEEAAEYARRWIDEFDLAEQSKYSLLRREDVEAVEPLLVREEEQERRHETDPHYYIVPFGFTWELDDRQSRLARVSVLVNAYSGNLEEITAFGQPVHYLSEEEALGVVASAMHRRQDQLGDAEASLMFQPSDITHVRAFPFWRVTVGERTLYVDQLGKLYGKLLASVPGD